MTNTSTAKQAVANAAISWLLQHQGDSWNVGIGTGTTTNTFIALLGNHRDRVGMLVASSKASATLLEAQGFRVSNPAEVISLDVYIDGADTLTADGLMIKGGGGALFGEKLIAGMCRTFVCIAQASKLVAPLGGFPIAVEVIPRARSLVARKIVSLGGQPEWREGFITDQGNHIIDVHNLDITHPQTMEDAINAICGVVENGLFTHQRADWLILGKNDGTADTLNTNKHEQLTHK